MTLFTDFVRPRTRPLARGREVVIFRSVAADHPAQLDDPGARCRVVGINGEHRAELPESLVRAAEVDEESAESQPGFDVDRIECGCAAQHALGGTVLARRGEALTQQHPRRDVLRRRSEHLAEHRDRLVEPAGTYGGLRLDESLRGHHSIVAGGNSLDMSNRLLNSGGAPSCSGREAPMTAVWPLVGRRTELQQLSEAAASGERGLVLAGDAGVGKTRLAREAVAALDPRRFRTAEAVASSSGQEIPYGALAHLLPSEAPSRSNGLGWAMAALLGAGDARRFVLLVDDAHLLDEPSAAVVLQLTRGDHAFVLATVRNEEPEPDAVRALWKDESLDRVELASLSRDDVAAMAGAMVGGDVDAPTARRLWQVTRGNPLYLRETVLTGREAGTFVERGGVFRWSGDVAMTSRLAELIGHRLGELDADETAAVEYVAFGEPVALSTLTDLAPRSAIEAVEARKLIVVEPDARGPAVRLGHPLYGEGLRARCPHLRAQHRMRELADQLERAGARGRDDTLRLAVWRLETGTAHDAELMLTACRIAWAAGDAPLATRLGWAALNAGGGVAAAVTLATILNWRERFDEAAAAVTVGEEHATSDADEVQLALVRAWADAYGRGEVDAAAQQLEHTRRSVEDDVPRSTLAVMRAELLITAGRGIAELPQLEAILANPRLPAPVEAQALVMTGFGYSHAGRRTAALDCLDREMRMVDQWRAEVPHEEARCAEIRSLTHLLAGELDASEAAIASLHQQGAGDWQWDFGIGVLGMSMAQVARVRGRVTEATRRSREALVALGSTAPTFRPCCLGELAHAEALAGDVLTSRRDLAEAEEQPSPGFGIFDYWVDFARTWVLACGGDVPAAVAQTMETADRAHEAGLTAFAVIAAHDAVRLGAADVAADRLLDATGRAEGPYPATCAAHLAALQGRDSAALLAVADGFAEMGMMLHAAEAAAQAATVLHDDRRSARSRAAGARAWALAERCQGARTPALADLRAPGLTPSEREIAELAAAGLTSREIAGRLTKSVRTVDNHLAHAYDKLGVHSRRDLSRLLDRA